MCDRAAAAAGGPQAYGGAWLLQYHRGSVPAPPAPCPPPPTSQAVWSRPTQHRHGPPPPPRGRRHGRAQGHGLLIAFVSSVKGDYPKARKGRANTVKRERAARTTAGSGSLWILSLGWEQHPVPVPATGENRRNRLVSRGRLAVTAAVVNWAAMQWTERSRKTLSWACLWLCQPAFLQAATLPSETTPLTSQREKVGLFHVLGLRTSLNHRNHPSFAGLKALFGLDAFFFWCLWNFSSSFFFCFLWKGYWSFGLSVFSRILVGNLYFPRKSFISLKLTH